jgi:hypothetical protein
MIGYTSAAAKIVRGCRAFNGCRNASRPNEEAPQSYRTVNSITGGLSLPCSFKVNPSITQYAAHQLLEALDDRNFRYLILHRYSSTEIIASDSKQTSIQKPPVSPNSPSSHTLIFFSPSFPSPSSPSSPSFPSFPSSPSSPSSLSPLSFPASSPFQHP